MPCPYVGGLGIGRALEFDIVFVVGMSEGVFPNHRSIRERGLKALEEERRLAYVAITRARKELSLTESQGYSYETFENIHRDLFTR